MYRLLPRLTMEKEETTFKRVVSSKLLLVSFQVCIFMLLMRKF